jgi:hypothetical protein
MNFIDIVSMLPYHFDEFDSNPGSRESHHDFKSVLKPLRRSWEVLTITQQRNIALSIGRVLFREYWQHPAEFTMYLEHLQDNVIRLAPFYLDLYRMGTSCYCGWMHHHILCGGAVDVLLMYPTLGF